MGHSNWFIDFLLLFIFLHYIKANNRPIWDPVGTLNGSWQLVVLQLVLPWEFGGPRAVWAIIRELTELNAPFAPLSLLSTISRHMMSCLPVEYKTCLTELQYSTKSTNRILPIKPSGVLETVCSHHVKIYMFSLSPVAPVDWPALLGALLWMFKQNFVYSNDQGAQNGFEITQRIPFFFQIFWLFNPYYIFKK